MNKIENLVEGDRVILNQLALSIYHIRRELQFIEALHLMSLQFRQEWELFPGFFWMTYCNSWDKLYLRLYSLLDRHHGKDGEKRTLSLRKFLDEHQQSEIANDLLNDPIAKNVKEIRNSLVAHINESLRIDQQAFETFYQEMKSHFAEFKPFINRCELIVHDFLGRLVPSEDDLQDDASLQKEVNDLFGYIKKAHSE